MPTISCFFHRLFFRPPYVLTFVQFEKFIKVSLNSKSVILTNAELVSNKRLYQIFIMSLLLTKDTSKIELVVDECDGLHNYGVATMRHWGSLKLPYCYDFTQLEKASRKNPLNASEPKRASSDKKCRKFFKSFHTFYENEMIKDTLIIYEEFFYVQMIDLFDYFDRYIEHESKIAALSSIMHTYGRDVYRSVQRFM
jgi:hypothetical protein